MNKAKLLRQLSRWSQLRKNSYFVTSPIFYSNGYPHIGHLYTGLLADASYRWQLMRDPSSQAKFSIGTDEHGSKIQKAASSANMSPLQFCNEISQQFQIMFNRFEVQPTDYIRTTENRHVEAVHHFWKELNDAGVIYKDNYGGWYSSVDETFYTDSEIIDAERENGQKIKVSILTGNSVEPVTETNYMFRMSQFGDRIRKWLTENDIIQPSQYLPAALALLNSDRFGDLSISREVDRLQWAIDVPDDPTQKVYVWLDALVNYLTVAGYPSRTQIWPPDCQILGQDIIRFHAIVWPALLMATNKQLPKKLFVHGHWLVDGTKMSKSKGNVVNPMTEADALTAEGLRYFLLRQGVPNDDGNYSHADARHVINDELANNLGNLLSRSTTKRFNPARIFPPFHGEIFDREYQDDGPQLIKGLHYMCERMNEYYDHLHFYKGIQMVQNALRQTNAFYQYHKPWTHISKLDGNLVSEKDRLQLETTLHVTYQTLRLCGLFLQPIVPNLACRLLNRLGIPKDERSLKFCKVFHANPVELSGRTLGETAGSRDLLFEKIAVKQ